jgi:hypothetical protein
MTFRALTNQPSQMHIETIFPTASPYPTNQAYDYSSCDTANQAMKSTFTTTPDMTQHQVSDVHSRVGLLSLQLQVEQQKFQLLHQLVNSQQEALNQLQSTGMTNGSRVGSAAEGIQEFRLQLDMAQAKIVSLEEKVALQSKIMQLQEGWIQELLGAEATYTCEGQSTSS